jgi:hypothetical protein
LQVDERHNSATANERRHIDFGRKHITWHAVPGSEECCCNVNGGEPSVQGRSAKSGQILGVNIVGKAVLQRLTAVRLVSTVHQ